ncbi:MAG: hypothetical protein CME65_10065 [Halobacteriovoraceae bacterium]|nr:hypothetical protein [Halobacteriovoraceae bacterium]|tara:strand:- start:841 stop:1146 length:306 start_codon:yes stop_codon:yes gene_type:complete
MSKKFRTLDLSIEQYQAIKKLKLKGEIRSQIERAALSVCLNLQEGNAKLTQKERRRFFNIAYASQCEVQLVLKLENIADLEELANSVGGHCYRLQHRTQGH